MRRDASSFRVAFRFVIPVAQKNGPGAKPGPKAVPERSPGTGVPRHRVSLAYGEIVALRLTPENAA